MDKNDPATLGGRLQWLRENALGLSSLIKAEAFLQGLSDVERPKDTSQKTLGRYEKDQQSPRCDLVSAYAAHSGIRIEWIFTGSGPRYSKIALDRSDPFVGSLARHVQDGFVYYEERDVKIGFDPKDVLRAYEEAIEFRWPLVELARLDQWRDELFREHHYEEAARVPGDALAWTRHRSGRILRPGLNEVVGLLIGTAVDATEEELEAISRHGFDMDYIKREAAKRRAEANTSPTTGEVAQEDAGPPSEEP